MPKCKTGIGSCADNGLQQIANAAQSLAGAYLYGNLSINSNHPDFWLEGSGTLKAKDALYRSRYKDLPSYSDVSGSSAADSPQRKDDEFAPAVKPSATPSAAVSHGACLVATAAALASRTKEARQPLHRLVQVPVVTPEYSPSIQPAAAHFLDAVFVKGAADASAEVLRRNKQHLQHLRQLP